MGIRLVVSDMDGTLFGKDERLPAFASEFSHTLERRGILFAAATGRSMPLARRFIDLLAPTAPCVYANGALICSDKLVLKKVMFPLYPLREILAYAVDCGMSVAVNWDEREEFVLKHTPWTIAQSSRFGIYQREYGPTLNEWKTRSAYKILIKDAQHRIERITEPLKELAAYCSFVKYETGAAEIMAEGLNKAQGVLQLASALHIDRGDVLAIGDFYNDIEMMTSVGWSAAVGNAIDEVKERAGYVCRGEMALGVKEAIEKFCLS
jgi:hypothetical protein